jgi:hypothetical protein
MGIAAENESLKRQLAEAGNKEILDLQHHFGSGSASWNS